MFRKERVLGKRSAACKDSQVEEDNKSQDTLCNQVKEEYYENQPDSYGLPLKKFKKMSLESVKVTELQQDKKVRFGFNDCLIALYYQSCHFPSKKFCKV